MRTKPKGWQLSQVSTSLGPSSYDDDVANGQRDFWEGIWDGGTSPTSLEPLQEELDRLRDSGPRMPPMEISRLRRAAKSFPVRTAVGADSWRPRHWALVLDQALAVLGYLFYMCEQCGGMA